MKKRLTNVAQLSKVLSPLVINDIYNITSNEVHYKSAMNIRINYFNVYRDGSVHFAIIKLYEKHVQSK